MRENFAKSLALTLPIEGGKSDDPADHGGRTNQGITQRTYDAWREEQRLAPRDVFLLTDEERDEIYLTEFWLPTCDLLPTGIDYLFFDIAVNGGPHEAALLLQRAVGVAADGRIGPVTRNAVRQMPPRRLIDSFTAEKQQFYRSLHQPKYIRGWLKRCETTRTLALAMLDNLKTA